MILGSIFSFRVLGNLWCPANTNGSYTDGSHLIMKSQNGCPPCEGELLWSDSWQAAIFVTM